MAAPETSSPIEAPERAHPGSLSGESAAIPGRSPWECLIEARRGAPEAPLFLWEAPDGEAVAGIGAVSRLEASGKGRFAEIRSKLSALFAGANHPGAIAIGGFSFAEQGPHRGWPGFADASFHVPSRVFWRAPGSETIETRWSAGTTSPDTNGATEPEPAHAWDREAWIDAVRLTLDRIREGAFSKAVLARSVGVPLGRPADPVAILSSLRDAYPACYRFLIADGRGNAFLGASPERLVRFTGGEIRSEAVAGTQRCEPGDEGAADALVESEKDRSEHAIVLRHLVETLTPLCESVAAGTTEVMRLPHLLHLRTPVHGRAREGTHILDLVSGLHPTPAVAGWPRPEALRWIREAEASGRGWYAGPVGWVNAGGEGDFAVGIRAVALRGAQARLFAGAGIVEGSDPGLEWSETELKMKGILDAVARD